MDGWSSHGPGRFTPGNAPEPIVQGAGWAPRPVRMGAKISSPPDFDSYPTRDMTLAVKLPILIGFGRRGGGGKRGQTSFKVRQDTDYPD